MNQIQQKILEIYKNSNGNLPPYRSLAKLLNVSSLNTVAYHINKLKEQGHLSTLIEQNGIVKLNLKNLIQFKNKSGVYVLLKNKDPFYIGEASNIKDHFIKNVLNDNNEVLNKIERDVEKINVAFYVINEIIERENLKNHLIEFYSKQGFKLL